ncbi:hypothetical protein Dimus_013053, partial [Dionaea muscipula]
MVHSMWSPLVQLKCSPIIEATHADVEFTKERTCSPNTANSNPYSSMQRSRMNSRLCADHARDGCTTAMKIISTPRPQQGTTP